LAVCICTRRSWLTSLLILAAGCGWFVLVDVLRIVAMAGLSDVLKTQMAREIAAGVLDYLAVILMLSLVISTDRIGLMFRKSARTVRRPKRARRKKKSPPAVTTVTVTGVTMDANGQLITVVSKYVPESPTPWPVETTPVAAMRHALRPDWPVLATVYGLLCLAQAIWLPSASDAATGRKTAAEEATHLEMPAEFAGWQLEKSATRQGESTQPESIDERPGPVVSWLYRRYDLTFKFSIRTRSNAWRGAVEAWRERGWQLDLPHKAIEKNEPVIPVIAAREVRLLKPYQPGYACIWESRLDAGGPFWSQSEGGWQAVAVATGERARQIYMHVQNIGQTATGDRNAATGRLDVDGVLISYRALGQEELLAGRELFYRLAAQLDRNLAPDERARP
jgi:hypothetical protein